MSIIFTTALYFLKKTFAFFGLIITFFYNENYYKDDSASNTSTSVSCLIIEITNMNFEVIQRASKTYRCISEDLC